MYIRSVALVALVFAHHIGLIVSLSLFLSLFYTPSLVLLCSWLKSYRKLSVQLHLSQVFFWAKKLSELFLRVVSDGPPIEGWHCVQAVIIALQINFNSCNKWPYSCVFVRVHDCMIIAWALRCLVFFCECFSASVLLRKRCLLMSEVRKSVRINVFWLGVPGLLSSSTIRMCYTSCHLLSICSSLCQIFRLSNESLVQRAFRLTISNCVGACIGACTAIECK